MFNWVNSFMPHGHCFLWLPELLVMHVGSDIVIALAYFSIPASLVYLVWKRQDLVFNWVFLMFAAFILLCGLTHVMGAVTVWYPVYYIDGSIKVVTATVSMITALGIWKLMPEALSLPSHGTMKAALEREKNAQSEARETRDKLQHILDAAQEGIYGVDLNGNTIFANLAAERMLGYSLHDVEGQTQHGLIQHSQPGGTPCSGEECHVYEAFTQNKTTHVTDEVFWRKDGTCFPVEYISAPMKDDNGNTIGAVVTFQDISERQEYQQQLEEALQQREAAQQQAEGDREFLNALLNNLSEGIVACDAEGNLSIFNRAAREFHGLTEEPIPAEEWADYYSLYNPDDMTLLSTDDLPLYRAFQGEKVEGAELVIAPRDRKCRTLICNGQSIISASGEELGAVVAMHDVTEQKAAELSALMAQNEVRRSKEHLQTILDSTHSGIYGLDKDGNTTFVNAATLLILGYSYEEVMGKNSHELFHHSYPNGKPYPQEECVVYKTLHLGNMYHDDSEVFWRKDGTAVPIQFISSPLRDDSGEITGAVVSFQNISELLQSRRKLKENMEELAERNQELDQFAHVASHDLKAPLNAIARLAEWIEEDSAKDLSDESRSHLELMKGRIIRMRRLLDDLLTYARAGRNKTPVEEINVVEIANDIFDLQAVENFELHVAEIPDALVLPRVPFEQVLRNLFSNAIKHHDKPVGHIDLLFERVANRYRFGVRDDGPGIPEEYHERIFGMFQTLKPRDETEGSGMGLAFVKKLIHAYNGRIWIESKGRGATLWFDWPAPPAWRKDEATD